MMPGESKECREVLVAFGKQELAYIWKTSHRSGGKEKEAKSKKEEFCGYQ